MTGVEHYLAAERILQDVESGTTVEDVSAWLAAAQVHATLAQAAASAMGAADMDSADFDAWDRVCGVKDPCTRCTVDERVTVGLVCQACGVDYGATDG